MIAQIIEPLIPMLAAALAWLLVTVAVRFVSYLSKRARRAHFRAARRRWKTIECAAKCAEVSAVSRFVNSPLES